MKRPSVPRKTANLSKSIHQQLNAYAIAAGAAGVSLLVLAQPADAKIIYTPAHVVIGRTFPLDLNHDGIIDFWIVDGFNESHAKHGLSVCQVMSSYHGPFCRNSPTNAIRAVRKMGIDVIEVPYTEGVKHGGGVSCATMRLKRDVGPKLGEHVKGYGNSRN